MDDQSTQLKFPNSHTAGTEASSEFGIIFLDRSFYGIVWLENGVRRTRVLKWIYGEKPESLMRVGYKSTGTHGHKSSYKVRANRSSSQITLAEWMGFG